MRKALIYGLTLAFALTLTACGQPRAEEPGAPDPAASAAVQTASPEATMEPAATPESSEETPTAPAGMDTQPAGDTVPEETPEEQTPEGTGETESTQSPEETEPTTTVKPTTQPSGHGNTDQAQTPPSASGQVTDAEIQAQIDAALKQQQEAIANGEVVGNGQVTQGGIEEISNRLSGGQTTQPAQPSGGYSSSNDGLGFELPPDYEPPKDPVLESENAQSGGGSITWEETQEEWKNVTVGG